MARFAFRTRVYIMKRSHRLGRGFTLMEVAVAAAILAMLAAVTSPYLVEFIDKQQAQTTADKLAALAAGVAAFENNVHSGAAATALTYPGRIGELANAITASNASYRNSCGVNFNATAVTGWNSFGPFVTFYVDSTNGYSTPLGMVSDAMVRNPTTANGSSTGAGTLALRMIAIDSSDAVDLDLIVDGGDGGASGVLRYTIGTTTAHMADVSYFIPVADQVLKRRRAQQGFTLAEVLVAFVLIGVLAAVIVPTVRGRLQSGYESAIISEFTNLSSAITAYRQDVGKYPPSLDYLSALRTPTPLDRCGIALSANAIASWRGPYTTRTIPIVGGGGGYMFASKDTIADLMSVSTAPVGFSITLKGPDTLTAHNVDLQVDGVANATAGNLQWTVNGADVWINYIIATKSGAC